MEDPQNVVNGLIRQREEEDNSDFRNVRRNIDDEEDQSHNIDPLVDQEEQEELEEREEPFCENEILSMVNMSMVHSHTAGVVLRRPFNPNSHLISLRDLLLNGSQHGRNILVIILSITSASGNNDIKVQKRMNGNRGQVNSVRHDRKMVVMCPFSEPGKNTAVILFGSGSCDRFFDADISLRDNGAIRELNANVYLYETILLTNIIFILYFLICT